MKAKSAKCCLLAGKALALLLFLFVLPGCFWGDEFETKHLTGSYYLSEVEPDSGTWSLYFADEEWGLADALLSNIVEAGFNSKCIILRAVGPPPQFYVVPLSSTKDREVARCSIVGPLPLAEFRTAVQRIAGNDLPRIDPELTKAD
jgi:hypothetical protein